MRDRSNEVVVAGVSAAHLHHIGDLWASRHEFVAPRRRQSQRTEIRYRQRVLHSRDVTLVGGLPAMTMERTVADLVEEVDDLSLVADVLGYASRKGSLDLRRLEELLAPLAGRHGLPKDDGLAFLDQLMEIAGLDADTALGPRVAERFCGDPSKAGINRLMMTPEIQKTMRPVQKKMAATLHQALAPRLSNWVRPSEPGS
ncbi:hypothetical protein [uncultured Friedmanniella sp.]|uniref:hypothetical protein n=1 Tax=uncultured Friedmanniella sp. TaxID=335381 RepID=UPI0035CAC0CF